MALLNKTYPVVIKNIVSFKTLQNLTEPNLMLCINYLTWGHCPLRPRSCLRGQKVPSKMADVSFVQQRQYFLSTHATM